MLNRHRMRLLVELRRRATLARVAQALSSSTSTISQQLSRLATEADVGLIEPVGRGVRLTAPGQILVEHAEQIPQQIDRAEAALAATRSIPDLLRTMSERHPVLTVYLSEIQPDAGAAALLAREFDLVLREQYPDTSLRHRRESRGGRFCVTY